MEPASQTEAEEPAQPSDDASLPSTSQEPSSSSAGTQTHMHPPALSTPGSLIQSVHSVVFKVEPKDLKTIV